MLAECSHSGPSAWSGSLLILLLITPPSRGTAPAREASVSRPRLSRQIFPALNSETDPSRDNRRLGITHPSPRPLGPHRRAFIASGRRQRGQGGGASRLSKQEEM